MQWNKCKDRNSAQKTNEWRSILRDHLHECTDILAHMLKHRLMCAIQWHVYHSSCMCKSLGHANPVAKHCTCRPLPPKKKQMYLRQLALVFMLLTFRFVWNQEGFSHTNTHRLTTPVGWALKSQMVCHYSFGSSGCHQNTDPPQFWQVAASNPKVFFMFAFAF